ncbi:hypothetical protein D3C79_997750 [compost metagenome]
MLLTEAQQAADAKAGTRADHQCRSRRVGLAGADLAHLVLLQAGHAQGHRREVVDQQ